MPHRLVPLSLALSVAVLSAAAVAQEAEWVADARAAAMRLPPKLVTALNEEIARSGAEGAIGVCRDMAPPMAKEVAMSTGWQLKRVSLKARNASRATPDEWERAVLEEFDRRVAVGEDPAKVEKAEVVDKDGQRAYRYAKALPTQALCLNCHGALDTLTPEVRARLKEHYAEDRATGYAVGQVRGAIVATKPF